MRFSVFICFSLIVGSLYSQRDSVRVNALDEVLLFGNQHTISSIDKELFTVNTISAQQINQVGANNLADILNQQLNISITPNAADGRSTISMFGLSGDYVKILVDNVPLVSDNGYGNNIAFMRDEGDGGRYDAQTAQIGYQLALNLFSRTLR